MNNTAKNIDLGGNETDVVPKPFYTNPLNNSRVLDVHKWSEHPEVKSATEEVLGEITKLKAFQKANKNMLATHLRVVLLDLYHRYLIDPEGYIGYSRNKNSYKKGSRYNKLNIAYTPLMNAVDGLIELGYIEHHKGFYDRRRGGKGFQSRMRATRKLFNLIAIKHNVLPEHIERYDEEEVIILNDRTTKERIEYPDTEFTIEARNKLLEYNKVIESTHIDLAIDLEYVQLNRRYDLSDKKSVRVFTGDWDQGGRFYHAWWVEIPSELRRFITINGLPTVEIDFKGLHIFMLYFMKKLDPLDKKSPFYFEDPYDVIEGIPKTKQHRALLKQLLLRIINCKDKAEARKSILLELRENPELYPDDVDIDEVMTAFEEAHKPIAEDYFYSDIGITLQRMDSEIVEEIITFFTELTKEDPNQTTPPVLGIHDSIICVESMAAQVSTVMQTAYGKVINEHFKTDTFARPDITPIKVNKNIGAGNIEDLNIPNYPIPEEELTFKIPDEPNDRQEGYLEGTPLEWITTPKEYNKRLRAHKEEGITTFITPIGIYTVYNEVPDHVISVKHVEKITEEYLEYIATLDYNRGSRGYKEEATILKEMRRQEHLAALKKRL